ncbi:hypothetical protein GXW82_14535 [Streptacidiphilus sp. 4-A2]|nr:hypothetical protein [Streptacidiphilus sp. 4-A2]
MTTALLAAGAAVAMPAAAADAATPAPPKLPLALTVSADAPAKALQPGGPAGSVTIKVSNSGAKAVDLNLDSVGLFSGPLTIQADQLTLGLTPEAGTPATGFSVSQSPQGFPSFGVSASVYPEGHPNAAFEVPAHTTFTWKLSVGVGKSWTVNDGQIYAGVAVEEQGRSMHESRGVDLQVGNGRTGGPILVSLAGAGKLSPGHPALEKLTVTNHTGARIAQSMHFDLNAVAGTRAGQVDFKVYEWVGAHGKAKAHWQDVTRTGFAVDGVANGASAAVELEVAVASYNVKAASETGYLVAFSNNTMPTYKSGQYLPLTVLR